MEDKEIIRLYFEKDETAIEKTKEKYGHWLKTLSYGIVRDIQTAEECENDTYLKAWQTIPPKDPKEYFYPYLACIIRNISLNCCRIKKSLKRSAHICELSAELETVLPGGSDTESMIDEYILKSTINNFLASISKDKRIVFVRRYFYLDSVSDIAKNIGVSESKVKVTLMRLRQKVSGYLKKEGYTL